RPTCAWRTSSSVPGYTFVSWCAHTGGSAASWKPRHAARSGQACCREVYSAEGHPEMNRALAPDRMHLIEVLLPVYDNKGIPFPRGMFDEVRRELTDQFGGVTAFVRAPAEGLWKEEDGAVVRDDIVLFEVM